MTKKKAEPEPVEERSEVDEREHLANLPAPPMEHKVYVSGVFPVTVTAPSGDYAKGMADGMIRQRYPEFHVTGVSMPKPQ